MEEVGYESCAVSPLFGTGVRLSATRCLRWSVSLQADLELLLRVRPTLLKVISHLHILEGCVLLGEGLPLAQNGHTASTRSEIASDELITGFWHAFIGATQAGLS